MGIKGKNVLNRKFLLLLGFFFLSFAPVMVSACTNSTGQWVNCTISYNTTDPIQGVFHTIQLNAPWFFWIWYISIYIGIVVITRIAHQEGTASFTYAAFSGVILAILFKSYGWISGAAVGVALAIMAITLLVLYLFRQG